MATFIEVKSDYNCDSYSFCRCCFLFSENPMESLFDSVYDGIELHEIINLLVPVAIVANDGKMLVMTSANLNFIHYVYRLLTQYL